MSADSGPGVHLPPPLFFVIAIGLGVLAHRIYPLQLVPSSARPASVVGGWLLVATWPVLTGWAMFHFARARTAIVPNRPASTLVTSGPYRLSRNPMYVAMTALYLGVSLLVDSLWTIVLLPGVLAVVRFWIVPREEAHLGRAFGDAYESYRARVRRWL